MLCIIWNDVAWRQLCCIQLLFWWGMLSFQVGDGTNFVLLFAGALLENAEELLRMGLSSSEVVEGFEKACEKALEILPSMCCASSL